MRVKMSVSKGFGCVRKFLTKSSRRRLVPKLKRSAKRAQRRAIRREDFSAKMTERDLV